MHVDRVYAYALHLLGNREDAEEVASEAFVKALRHAADFRGESAFRGWLFGITRNLCRDRLSQPALWSIEGLESPLAVPDEGDRIAIRTDVRRAMGLLPEDYREVLLLCDAEEWNHAEAAKIMG